MKRRLMKNGDMVYLFFAVMLMIFILAGSAWAEDPNSPNAYGCCLEDKPGDGPPEGSSALSSLKGPLALAATSVSSSTKTFRTDTGPELDFYQP